MRAFLFLLCVVAAALSLRAYAQDATILVASPKLQGGWAKSVVLCVPYRSGHIGVILNRPMRAKLIDLFPNHPPARAVTDDVHFGGPTSRALYALVRQAEAPSPRAVAVMPGVWFVFESLIIDAIIEARPNSARYFAGMVVWQSGELDQELKRGMFAAQPAVVEKLFLPDTSKMWEEMSPGGGLRTRFRLYTSTEMGNVGY